MTKHHVLRPRELGHLDNHEATMHPFTQAHSPMYAPGHIHGFRKDGRPIYAVAGGSGGNEPAEPGTTIAVPRPPAEPAAPPASNGQTFTAADIEEARKQEKDKLYGRIEELGEKFKTVEKERADRLAAEEKKRKDAEAEAEAERQKNLSFEQKLAETEATWAQKFETVNQQVAQSAALLEAERRFQTLQEFRARRLGEEVDIMPNLHAWITGASEAEIEDAISRAKDTTASILNDVTQAQQQSQVAQQQARQAARGAGVTAPPVGPMENNPGYESFSADDIRNMDMGTYAKNRARLLEAASNQMRGRG